MIGLTDLAWYPKPFGAGDMDGSGEKKVLGRPEVDMVDLLVRETAQNSWDARLPGEIPRFELRQRLLDERTRDVLTWNVFADRLEGSPLDVALGSRELTALEVVDRGTKGLGGPTSNSASRGPDDPNDFATFVLTVGAPPEDPAGGGSYGFGKTASYLASTCSTIVIWSRSRTGNGDLVERFVASSMGKAFDLEGRRFTGRQWWGAPQEGSATQGLFDFAPVEGDGARKLGEAVFERHFEPGETGTSILVIGFDPPRNGDDGEDDDDGDDEPLPVVLAPGELLARAVVRNLWPKLAVDQPQEWRMDVLVTVDGVEVPLPGFPDSPVLQGLRKCLNAVRAEQAGEAQSSEIVQVLPTDRHGRVTGHLALTPVITHPATDPWIELADTVALMRHRAELIVCNQGYSNAANTACSWVGAFKPQRDLDRAFADAEPPAHDSWTNVEGLDKTTKSIVIVTLRKIQARVRSFLTPSEPSIPKDDHSTAALAAALAGLTGGLAGSGASKSNRPVSPRRGTRSVARKVELVSVEPMTRSEEDIATGRQRTKLTASVTGTTPALLRLGGLAVAIDGGTMQSENNVALDSWQGGEPVGDGVKVGPDEQVSAIVAFPAGIAISFSFRAEDT